VRGWSTKDDGNGDLRACCWDGEGWVGVRVRRSEFTQIGLWEGRGRGAALSCRQRHKAKVWVTLCKRAAAWTVGRGEGGEEGNEGELA